MYTTISDHSAPGPPNTLSMYGIGANNVGARFGAGFRHLSESAQIMQKRDKNAPFLHFPIRTWSHVHVNYLC